MTIDELAKLSDEELRVMCAELCGAKWYLFESGYSWISFRDLTSPRFSGSGSCKLSVRAENPRLIQISGSVPDYPADLNAMAEAESVLSDEEHRLFRKLLFTGHYNRGEGTTNDSADRATVSATARQRCIAFIAVKHPSAQDGRER